MPTSVPSLRIHPLNKAAVRTSGGFVLYWMVAQRRLSWNFSLDRALQWARELGKPVLIFEALRVAYPWASERIHAFVLDGMVEHAGEAAKHGALYLPYVERVAGEGRGLLETLANEACVVVTDDFPCFFLPRMVGAAAARLKVLVEAVDANGLLPLRAAQKAHLTAYDFRRFLQRELPKHLAAVPSANPLGELVPFSSEPAVLETIRRRWGIGPLEEAHLPSLLRSLPIDHEVGAVDLRGGSVAAQRRLHRFLREGLRAYADRRHPDLDVGSGLSPFLHFGFISAHEVFHELAAQEEWQPERCSTKATGKREGWWGMSPAAEAFIDELVTWREIGYNTCLLTPHYDRYESLPAWARASLDAHRGDTREYVYSLSEFAASRTHDPIWNAAQSELRETGRLHNYLRMLWGKKILEWTASPEEAIAVMVELNNRYALDGRNPNSYSGIFWCLGRYDRPWAPERPVFGVIRFMSSESTKRKCRMTQYLARFGSQAVGPVR